MTLSQRSDDRWKTRKTETDAPSVALGEPFGEQLQHQTQVGRPRWFVRLIDQDQDPVKGISEIIQRRRESGG